MLDRENRRRREVARYLVLAKFLVLRYNDN